MQKDPIDLAYDRLHSELNLHWTRINLMWLIVTLAFTALGYLLYQYAVAVHAPSQLFHTLLVLSSAATVIASWTWRAMQRAGTSMVEVLEQKLGHLEHAAGVQLYLSIDHVIDTHDKIIEEYEAKDPVRVSPHTSVAIAVGTLTAIAAIVSLTLHLLIVFAPFMLFLDGESTVIDYFIAWATIVAVVVIEVPFAIEWRGNQRRLDKESVQQLKDALRASRQAQHPVNSKATRAS